MESNIINKLASDLYEAEKSCQPIDTITDRYQMTNDEAYQIQIAGMNMRMKDGHVIVGKKIGLTSKAMQHSLGVFEPDYGYITDRMMVFEGECISMETLVAPKVEAELGFVLKTDLKGPGVTVSKVLQATAGVMPALEVIDTRIKNWKIKVQDSIADAASIGRIVTSGKLTPIDQIDLRYLGLVFEKNGEVVSTAAGAAVLGHPAYAVAWLANKLSDYGIALNAGDFIMAGSFIAACPVAAGDAVRASFDRVGTVAMKFIK